MTLRSRNALFAILSLLAGCAAPAPHQDEGPLSLGPPPPTRATPSEAVRVDGQDTRRLGLQGIQPSTGFTSRLP